MFHFYFLKSLSRNRDGLLITEVDLNHCRQMKDFWGLPMTRRLKMYTESLQKAVDPDYQPQIVRETTKRLDK